LRPPSSLFTSSKTRVTAKSLGISAKAPGSAAKFGLLAALANTSTFPAKAQGELLRMGRGRGASFVFDIGDTQSKGRTRACSQDSGTNGQFYEFHDLSC
jgi:hypothetical protein